MEPISLKTMIKAGMHFGHQASRWNPRMAPFIFQKRNLIHIIDLRKSVEGLVAASLLLERIAARGQQVLLVGTKRQAKTVVRAQAQRCSQPYVAERWPGGLLTNYTTIRKRLDRLRELERWEETGEINLYSKKMISTFRREKRKITRNLGGVREMETLPGAVVVVDPGREYIAIREASRLHIPTIALADTDCNPERIDIVIPGNDDSIGSIEIFYRYIADAILRGIERRASGMPPEQPQEAGAQQPETTKPTPPPIAEAPRKAERAAPETDRTPTAQQEPTVDPERTEPEVSVPPQPEGEEKPEEESGEASEEQTAG